MTATDTRPNWDAPHRVIPGHIRRHLVTLLPGPDDLRPLRRSWRRDLLAGVTVGIVALPLALAFGVSSGMGAAAGLVTAIVAGLLLVASIVSPSFLAWLKGKITRAAKEGASKTPAHHG